MVRATISQRRTNRKRGSWRWMRGQNLVEFAAGALTLFILSFSILSLGQAIYSYSFVSNAARDAVRYAIVHGSASLSPASKTDIQNYVLNYAHGMDSKDITVTTTWTPDNKPGSLVNVQVTYSFEPLFPMSGAALSLTSSAQMIISR